jgi:hypothetical protein
VRPRSGADAFHPIGLPASFITDGVALGIDPQADPSFEDVVRVHAQRLDGIRGFLADVTQDELDRVRDTNPAAAWPPPGNPDRSPVPACGVLRRTQ